MLAPNNSRRHFLNRTAVAVAGLAMLKGCAAPNSPDILQRSQDSASAAQRLAELEKSAGGRLGVALLDTGTGRTAGHRLDERFAMCSTFKWPLSAVILKAVEDGALALDQPIAYGVSDLLDYAPVTHANVASGSMTIAQLMEATITTSDNTAANLLLALIGGPAGVTQKFRAWGDPVTRLDRYEPDMNRVGDGDERDTSSPSAMAALLRIIFFSDLLSPASRSQLIAWGGAARTGMKRLRAGLPDDWQTADKTGTGTAPGMVHRYNDIGLTFPTGRAPLIITAFYDSGISSDDMRDADQAVLAKVGQIAADWVTSG